MPLDFLVTRDPVTDEQRMSFVNGDWETIDGAEECNQRIETALKTILGEYKFDLKKGMPIFDQIFRKTQDPTLILSYYRRAILQVNGLRAINELRIEPDGERRYKIIFSAIYEDNTVINGEI